MTLSATLGGRNITPSTPQTPPNPDNPGAENAVGAAKTALRRRLLATRAAATTTGVAAAAVSARLATLPELAAVHVVLGYAATGHEVSIDALLRQLLAEGATVCLPWVEGRRLGLATVSDLDADLAPGWRGVREPRVPRDALRPHRLDAVIAPGVGFDGLGHRLGYGGGHFDRLLRTVRPGVPVIGVALDEQVVTAVPVADHDRPVNVIVTPTRTLRP